MYTEKQLISKIGLRFQEIINEEIEKTDFRWRECRKRDLLSGGPHPWDVETIALKLAGLAKIETPSYESSSEYSSQLLANLEYQRQSFLRLYQDVDGWGSSTISTVAGRLREYIESLSVVTGENFANGDLDYGDLLEDIDESLRLFKSHLRTKDYRLAFDFAQIHLLQLSFLLFKQLSVITDVEVLLFSNRIKDVRSMLIELIVRYRPHPFDLTPIYRYIAGAQSLLTFVQSTKRKTEIDQLPGEDLLLPISLRELDYEKAIRRYERRKDEPDDPYRIYKYDPDQSHLVGINLLIKLEELVDEHSLQFLNRLFPRVIDLLSLVPGGATVLHYFTARSVSDRWNFENAVEILYCFVLNIYDPSDECFDIFIAHIGSYEEIGGLVNNVINASKHNVLFGSDRSGGELASDLSKLSDAIFRYFEMDVDLSENLFIVPEGIMSLVPYAALLDRDGRRFVETHTLTILTSLRSLSRHAKTHSDLTPRGIVVGNPNFDAGSHVTTDQSRVRFQLLRESHSECDEVSRITGWHYLSGDEATPKNVFDQLCRTEAIHLSTHGFYLGQIEEGNLSALSSNPDTFFEFGREILSGARIAMAGANSAHPSDAEFFIRSDDILNIDLHHLNFAYLALCTGSVGGTVTGEALFGMARAFLASGTNCVIASILPVEDDVAKLLSVSFYKNLTAGISVSRALRSAQLELIQMEKPWFSWAGFQSIL